MDAVTQRLACLITASVILHAAALAPLKARTTPPRMPFAPLLSAQLIARDEPPSAPRIPSASAPEPAPTQPEPQRPPPRDAATEAAATALASSPAPTTEAARQTPLAQPAGKPTPPSAEPASNAATQQQPGVRLAVADEVSVRVQLLSFDGAEKPRDSVQVQNKTYTYFKAPGLRRATQPLDDIKAHYPAQKPLYPHGAVMLQLLIDEEGRLEQANVICSNPDFEKSALASVEHLRFAPAQAVTGPVKSYMVVEFGYGRGSPCNYVPDVSPSR